MRDGAGTLRHTMINDVGLLLARLTLGASIAAHGAQKAWGVFGGPGPAGAAAFMESLGFRPGQRFATAASATEIGAGLAIALGAGGPIGPAALISTMVVAQTSVHVKNGYFAQNGGIELGTVYSAVALALASAGFGRFSVDEALGWQQLRAHWLTALCVGGGIVMGIAVLAQRGMLETSPNESTSGVGTVAPENSDAASTPPEHPEVRPIH